MIKGEVKMSKIMSVFEKLNLVEKAGDEKTDSYLKTEKNAKDEHEFNKITEEKIHIHEELQSSSNNDNDLVQYQDDLKENRKLSIQDIYKSYGVENSEINTVFMLGNFINALPESLPTQVRKKSVISIVASANTDLEMLIGDGEKRLEVLNQFSSDYYYSTVSAIETYKKRIDELRKQIDKFEDKIQLNENLLKEQNNIVKYETDKIEGIINFFKNGD